MPDLRRAIVECKTWKQAAKNVEKNSINSSGNSVMPGVVVAVNSVVKLSRLRKSEVWWKR